MSRCAFRRGPLLVALVVAAGPVLGSAQERRLFTVDDIFALRTVGDPRLSPDGAWVAYTVSTMDAASDRRNTDLYMASVSGDEVIQLTSTDGAETHPRWSPDGRYLAFLSGRDDDHTQVWLLDRRGGEATKATDDDTSVSSLAWSPDGRRLALVMRDEDDDADESGAAADPIVVTRLQFKRDGRGYLDDRRTHLYVFDLETGTTEQLTDGPYDDTDPVWSPDGRHLAFTSNRTDEPDANANTDIFIVPAQTGARPRRLTTSPGSDRAPAFSHDGSFVAYLAGGDPADIWYATNDVAVVPTAGGPSRRLTEGLDRNLSGPTVTRDDAFVVFRLEDRGNAHLARVPVAGGAVERIVAGERDIRTFHQGPTGRIAVLETQRHYPAEVSLVDGHALRRITRVNDARLAGITLAPVERFEATSADGTRIDAFLTRPPAAPAGARVPTVLRIHGGPVSQFSNRFSVEWQILAAHGYAVVGANPRGSSGRGRDFSHAIWADWGNKDFHDVMAAVDEAVARGVADPDRLGVGGWSYGGILTNYVITQTGRFKAAISGASEVNYTANYGHDHYQRQWEAELGLPWENVDLWIEMSPFFKVDRVTTPTLILCGELDWNVPLQNSDQLFQALRRLGVETELVIYPGQSHGISRPSYQKDRYERYLAWYDRFLK